MNPTVKLAQAADVIVTSAGVYFLCIELRHKGLISHACPIYYYFAMLKLELQNR